MSLNDSYQSSHHDFTENCKAVNFGVNITPNPTSFGSLCQGFTYTMSIKISIHTDKSIRLKATCISMKDNEPNEVTCSYLPMQVAPGISVPMTFTIKALNTGTCKYRYILHYGMYEKASISTMITAYVLPLEVYRNINKKCLYVIKSLRNDRIEL